MGLLERLIIWLLEARNRRLCSILCCVIVAGAGLYCALRPTYIKGTSLTPVELALLVGAFVLPLGVLVFLASSTGVGGPYMGSSKVLMKWGRPVTVRHLNAGYFRNKSPALVIDWRTLDEGIGALDDQMRGGQRTFLPDLCVGINDHGLLLAAALAMRRGLIASAVGHVRIGASHEVVEKDSLLPKLDHVRSILVVDLKIETGRGLEAVVSRLRKEYAREDTELQVKAAVLVASRVPPPLPSNKEIPIKELLCQHGEFPTDRAEYLPDFLAFSTSEPTVVVSPG